MNSKAEIEYAERYCFTCKDFTSHVAVDTVGGKKYQCEICGTTVSSKVLTSDEIAQHAGFKDAAEMQAFYEKLHRDIAEYDQKKKVQRQKKARARVLAKRLLKLREKQLALRNELKALYWNDNVFSYGDRHHDDVFRQALSTTYLEHE